MSGIFEKLKKIALEEFGCSLIQTQEQAGFEDLFGFSQQAIDDFADDAVFNMDENIVYVACQSHVFAEENADFDVGSLPQIALAA